MRQHATGNFRLWLSIEDVRDDRNPATMAELYDALNARRYQRTAHVPAAELRAIRREYLRVNAPDLMESL